jgi:ABC-2 type transport system permease protein
MAASQGQRVPATRARPGEFRTLWLIARRAALESLRDRMTLTLSLVFAIVLPVAWVLTAVRAQAAGGVASGQAAGLGRALAISLLSVGLLPATGAVGVASGQFAGEKEQGSLAPLLASPASNLAIFGGKILGSILPALLFALVAEATYLGSVALVLGPEALRRLPLGLALTMLALVPASALFAATVASLVSSRVRTFNTAQQITGLVLLPFWAALFGLTLGLRSWGGGALLAVVLGLLTLDAALVALAAATWRREEVLANS